MGEKMKTLSDEEKLETIALLNRMNVNDLFGIAYAALDIAAERTEYGTTPFTKEANRISRQFVQAYDAMVEGDLDDGDPRKVVPNV